MSAPALPEADRTSAPPGALALRAMAGNAALARWLGPRRATVARMMEDAEMADAGDDPLQIETDGHDYTATLLGNAAGSLTLYWDEGSQTQWINNIETEQGFRRRGVATALLRRAIQDHGRIYASTQTANEDTAEDTRHLEPDGQELVHRLIARRLPGLVLRHPNQGAAPAEEPPPVDPGQRLITDYFH